MGVARRRQQRLGFRHVMGIDAREIHIGGIARRKMAADRRAIPVHGAVDDGAAIQGVGNRSTHQEIAERRHAVIQRQHRLHLGGTGKYREAWIGRKLRKAFRGRIVGKCIHIARHQSGIGRGGIRDEFEGNFRQFGGPAPIVRVTDQGDGVATAPLGKSKRTGSDRSDRVGLGRLRRHHDERPPGERLQQTS